MSSHVFVFDFDGVLAQPYSDPPLFFPGAQRLLRTLHARGHTILVASFNPDAYRTMVHLHDEGIVSDIRAGSNDMRWWESEDGCYVDKLHRRALSKAAMITDMAGRIDTRCTIRFFDDDPENIHDVRTTLPHVTCHHVTDWALGLRPYFAEWFDFYV